MTAEDYTELAFESMDQAEAFVVTFTGIRQKLIEHGWTPQGAEQVIAASMVAGRR